MEQHIDPARPDGVNPTLHNPIAPGGIPKLGMSYIVPARQGRAVRVAGGQLLTIVNTKGTQVCDFWALDAADNREFLSMPHQHAAHSRVNPRIGDTLVSNMRREMMTLAEDTSPGVHDTLIAACDIHRYRQLGATDYHDNCTDNFRMALAAIEVRPAEVPAPFNIWMNTPADGSGSISWLSPVSKAGDYVVLRAARDLIAVISACPQDLVPVNGRDSVPSELSFVVSEGPSAS